MEDLLQQLAELQEAVRRLKNIRKAEKEIDSQFQAQSAVGSPPTAKQLKTPPLAQMEGKGANNADKWKLATAKTIRRKRLALAEPLRLSAD